MLSQQHVPVISKSNVNNILATISGTSFSQALAADDSMERKTVVIPERTSRGEMSKFGGRRSLYVTTWLCTGLSHLSKIRVIARVRLNGYYTIKFTYGYDYISAHS